MSSAVVVKKEEKVARILESMTDIYDVLEFKSKFKEMFPDDWNRIISRYNAEEKKTKPGKTHPMPNPEQYLTNMHTNAVNKLKKRCEKPEI